MKPYVGGMFMTRGGQVVGPIESHDMEVWKYTWEGLTRIHYWNDEGYHELEWPNSNTPEMDIIVSLDDVEINYEEIVG
jgi:hypothetical protein